MNILHINNFHYLRGGSETVFFNNIDILKKQGHKNLTFSMTHPNNISSETADYFVPFIDYGSVPEGVLNKFKAALRIFYYFEAKNKLKKFLTNYPVDIAHLHNIYHELSPSVIDALKSRHIPIVMTLHDYKMVCASYSMMIDGISCEACCGGKYYKAIKRRCVKGSFAKTVLAAMEIYLHNDILSLYDNVDVFISPSIFLKDKLKEMGFKKEIVYLPNFIDLNKFQRFQNIPSSEDSIVYFGRLSAEKGLFTLMEAAKGSKVQFKIIGEGQIRKELEKRAAEEKLYNIKFLGYMTGVDLYNEIKKSLAIVLPSECYENNPMSILEGFALSKPAIGARIGGIPELVIDGVTGFTFEPGNAEDLRTKIGQLIKDKGLCSHLGENARKLIEERFSSETYYKGLIAIYEKVLSGYAK